MKYIIPKVGTIAISIVTVFLSFQGVGLGHEWECGEHLHYQWEGKEIILAELPIYGTNIGAETFEGSVNYIEELKQQLAELTEENLILNEMVETLQRITDICDCSRGTKDLKAEVKELRKMVEVKCCVDIQNCEMISGRIQTKICKDNCKCGCQE